MEKRDRSIYYQVSEIKDRIDTVIETSIDKAKEKDRDILLEAQAMLYETFGINL